MENTFDRPLIPDNEAERLAELRRLNAMNTYDEQGTFKHIAAMATRMFQVPIALINLVGEQYVLTKAGVGLDEGTETARGTSLCSLAILKDSATVFENAKDEPCLLANPLVHGEFGLEFYAAAPLKTANGYNIGAVCILDKKSRAFSAIDQKILENLAAIVMDEMEKTQNDF